MKRNLEDGQYVSVEDVYTYFISRLPQVMMDDCHFIQMWKVEQDELENGSGVMVSYTGPTTPARYDYIVDGDSIITIMMPLSFENMMNFMINNIGMPDYGIIVIDGEQVYECNFPYNDVSQDRKIR